MQRSFTAVTKRDGAGWIGEIPGVNSQGRTRDMLMENLGSALTEALEFNRQATPAHAAQRARDAFPHSSAGADEGLYKLRPEGDRGQ